jgi:hypothetical protein
MGDVVGLYDKKWEKLSEIMGDSISSRHKAAEILKTLSSYGYVGAFPPGLTMEEIGWAIGRICHNSPEEEPYRKLMEGIYLYQSSLQPKGEKK